jgi:hypothetical protein
MNYLFIANRPVVLVNASDQSHTRSTTDFYNSLRMCLELQGYHEIIEWQTDEEQIKSPGTKAPSIITPNVKVGPDWINKHILKDFQSLTNYVIFDFSTVNASVISEQSMKAVCEAYIQRDPLLSEALRDYLAMAETTGFLQTQNQSLQEQIAGAEKTIGVIRTKYKDDYENLFKWYHNEYEILPLWYKRFGHILKVIMGKRSFRSLFSDDVKKYKS